MLIFSRWNFLPSYKSTRCKLGPLPFKHLVRDRGRNSRGTETVSEKESVKLKRPLATVLICHTGKSCGPIRTAYRRNNQPLIGKKQFLIVIIDFIVSRPAARLLYWLKLTFIPHCCVPTHIVPWLLLNVATAVFCFCFFAMPYRLFSESDHTYLFLTQIVDRFFTQNECYANIYHHAIPSLCNFLILFIWNTKEDFLKNDMPSWGSSVVLDRINFHCIDKIV